MSSFGRLPRLGAALLSVVSWADVSDAADARPGGVEDFAYGRGRGGGVYGRFDGDLALSLGGGMESDPTLGFVRPSALGTLRVYQAAGPYIGIRQSVDAADPVVRTLGLGITVEPLFLLRWSADREFGTAFWDLTLDSIALCLGAHFTEPRGGDFADVAGAELGLGFGVPLVGRAPGPWLRIRGAALTGRSEVDPVFFAHLEWQWFFEAGLLDD